MTLPATLALRDALKAILDAAPALQGIKIYDRVPEKPEPKFIGFGPMKYNRVEDGSAPLRPLTIRLFTASTTYQRDEAWSLAQAIEETLDGLSPDLAAPWSVVVELRVEQAGDIIEAGQPKQVFLDVTATVARLS